MEQIFGDASRTDNKSARRRLRQIERTMKQKRKTSKFLIRSARKLLHDINNKIGTNDIYIVFAEVAVRTCD